MVPGGSFTAVECRLGMVNIYQSAGYTFPIRILPASGGFRGFLKWGAPKPFNIGPQETPHISRQIFFDIQQLNQIAATEGLASYHFNSLEDCYISYDAAPETWRLDDGCRPPSKKPWEEVSYDPETRIFRGRSWQFFLC